MNTKPAIRIACLSLGMLTALRSAALAQTAQAPSAPASSADQSNIIQLSQFDVTASHAKGYQSTNSTTATGIGSPNIEVPLEIQVLTTDFMQDTNAVDIRDALRNVAGVVTDTRNESSFTIRGYNGNIAYFNGFYKRQDYQSWNTDRVEVIYGPAAIFFGDIRPGGLVNYVTQRPDFEAGTFTDVSAQEGSFSWHRADIDSNYVLNDKLAIRVNIGGLDSKNNGRTSDFLYEDFASLSATWRIAPNQVLNFYADKARRNDYTQERGDAMTAPGYLGNATAIANNWTVQQYVGNGVAPSSTTPIWSIWAPVYGPKDPYGFGYAYDNVAFEKFEDWDIMLFYDAKINDHIAWSTAINRNLDDQPGFRINGDGASVDISPNALGVFNNLEYEYFENDRNSKDMHNTLTVKFDTGSFHHTLILGEQYQAVTTDQPGTISASGSFSKNNYTAANYIVGYQPGISPFISGSGPINATFANNPLNDWVHELDTVFGYFASMQTSFWNDRIHALYGVRENIVDGSIWYTVRPTNPAAISQNKALTPQGGLIGEIVPGVSVFATYSRSMEPQNGTIDYYGHTASPIHDIGEDFGIKTELGGGRFSQTLDFFNSERTGLATEDTAREAVVGVKPLYIFGQAYDVRGVGYDGTLSVTSNDTVELSYQRLTKANYTASPYPNQIYVGQPIADDPTNEFTFWNRYAFKDDSLKGWVVGIGNRYESSAPVSSNPQITVRNPDFWVWNAMIQKTVSIMGRSVKLQLNVENLTNEVYREGTDGEFGNPRFFYLSAKTRF